MKTIILFLITFNFLILSQNSEMKLLKPLQLSDETQVEILIQTIIQLYGSSFKYYNELRKNNFNIAKSDNGYVLIILKNSKNCFKENDALVARIDLYKNEEENGNYSLNFDKNQLLELINKERFNELNLKNYSDNIDSIIYIKEFLEDMCICSDPFEGCIHKVFNRSLALGHVVDTDGNPSPLFYNIEDGLILPYAGGEKLIEVDSRWNSLIHLDRALTSNIWHYGEYGHGPSEFYYPTAATYGREVVNGDETIYPIYVADFGNNKVISVNYIARDPILGSGFNPESYSILNNLLVAPYDIGYFKAEDSNNDKIWVSEAPLGSISLKCLSINGDLVQRIIGYKDLNTQIIYPFEHGSQLRLSVFSILNNYFASIAFVDNMRNNLVCCPLNSDGVANLVSYDDGYIIEASAVERFPEDVRINSVAFHKTSQNTFAWPYLWVTSGSYTPPYYYESQNLIHCFKVNSSSHVAYLGSTSRPLNTDWDFVDLNNLLLNQGYYDIFTIERWSNVYGIRRFWPFAGIHSITVNDYCFDSTNQLLLNAYLTNDCWIKFSAERQNQQSLTGWEQVKIKSISGQEFNSYEAVIYRLAGWTGEWENGPLRIRLDLPLKDFAFGGRVKLHLKLYPEYDESLSGEYTQSDRELNVSKTCLPPAGGCPFLYVTDVNKDYIADNNILHRSEFGGEGDITDKYKIRVAPYTADNEIELSIVENENDYGFINMVKLYAVDYHSSKKMAVTEDNQIVLYDSATVVAADSVVLNDANITGRVNFHNPDTISVIGYNGDQMYAHFTNPDIRSKIRNAKNNLDRPRVPDSRESQNQKVPKQKKANERSEKVMDSRLHGNVRSGGERPEPVAFIADLSNLNYPVSAPKNYAGVLTANSIYSNQVQKQFTRRELSSAMVLPLFADTDKVDNMSIVWQSDFQMKYLGVTNDLQYSGFTATEAPIMEGKYITANDESNITENLMYIDEIYGEVSSSGLIKMKFDISNLPSVPEGYVRDYVVEVNGRYYRGDDGRLSDVKPHEIPLTYKLSQNYPNPFNAVTKIKFEIPKTTKVNLVIYDILGREVKKLVNNEVKDAGRYVVEFDMTNFASGVYFYRIEAGTFVQAKKMVLVK